MPEIIDGNAIDLVEAEIKSAQAVKFCCSCEIKQAAILHEQTAQIREMVGEIPWQIMDRKIPHGNLPDTVVS